jgi:hypothetical protein
MLIENYSKDLHSTAVLNDQMNVFCDIFMLTERYFLRSTRFHFECTKKITSAINSLFLSLPSPLLTFSQALLEP